MGVNSVNETTMGTFANSKSIHDVMRERSISVLVLKRWFSDVRITVTVTVLVTVLDLRNAINRLRNAMNRLWSGTGSGAE